jgi:hypothetical protein
MGSSFAVAVVSWTWHQFIARIASWRVLRAGEVLVFHTRSIVILDEGQTHLCLTESIMKAGHGKGGARRPAIKFPGLVKKLEQAAAKKSEQERPAYPGQIISKKRP